MLSEFRKFLMRGSIVDLAIGFTVGAAFTTVVKSLVDDVIMPVVGVGIGRVDFQDFFLVLDPGQGAAPFATIQQARSAGAVTLNYGLFINNLFALLIVAVVMFAVIRAVNRAQDALRDDKGADDHSPEEPDHKKCVYCRSTIHFRAVRCPECTSDLPTATENAAARA